METLISLLGIGILFGLGILLSSGRHQINWRTVGFALLLQFALGALRSIFRSASRFWRRFPMRCPAC